MLPSIIGGPAVAWGSLDHLVGAGEQLGRYFNAKHFGSLEVDHELEPSWLLNRQISRISALENLVDVFCCMPVLIRQAWRIAHKTTDLRKLNKVGNCRQPIRCHEVSHPFELDEEDRVRDEENTIGMRLKDRGEDIVEVRHCSHF
jgi:hypothetical protein